MNTVFSTRNSMTHISGMTKFFKVGPIHFLPKFIHLILGLVSTALFLLFRGAGLAVMIYSASATFPYFLTPYNNTLLAPLDNQLPCTSVTFVKDYSKEDHNLTWRTLRHMPLKMNSDLKCQWNVHPMYEPPGTEWVYFFDDQTKVQHLSVQIYLLKSGIKT